jgi:tripartite-type tricarboxylate transporter receptor subunit TctC
MYTGLLSGEPPVLTSVSSDLMTLAKASKAVPLAVSGDKHLLKFPEVPTFKELGVDMEVPGWYAIVAREGTPAPVIERFNRAISVPMQSRAVRAYLDLQMMQPLSGQASEVDR